MATGSPPDGNDRVSRNGNVAISVAWPEMPCLRELRLCVHAAAGVAGGRLGDGRTGPEAFPGRVSLSHIVRRKPVKAVEENDHILGPET